MNMGRFGAAAVETTVAAKPSRRNATEPRRLIHRFRLKLIVALLVLTALPGWATYYLVGKLISQSIQLGFDPRISEHLALYQNSLKELRHLAPERADTFRRDFESVRSLQGVLHDSQVLQRSLESTWAKTYLTFAGVAVLFAALIALVLARSLALDFSQALRAKLDEEERVRYLEGIAKWQEVAQKLAHEIKGMLTPIEMMVSGLPLGAIAEVSSPRTTALEIQLLETKRVVLEEIAHLKEMTFYFSEFSSLPEAKLGRLDIAGFLEEFVRVHARSWPEANLQFERECLSSSHVMMDPALWRQLLMNLVNNAVEANSRDLPGFLGSIDVTFTLAKEVSEWIVRIENTGREIPADFREKIFQLHFSRFEKGGSRREHFGIGLAVVRKIVLEHGGEIRCVSPRKARGAAFEIRLPRNTELSL